MKLANVLIADDDYLVVQDLKTLVNWEELGFRIVACAANGEKALAAFNKYRPELVITDVQMPGMDGLEFLEKIKSFSPETTVIVISSYDNFDYVKRAIRTGAEDYILKNELSRQTLTEKLMNIRSRLTISVENHERMTRIILSEFLPTRLSLEALAVNFPVNASLFEELSALISRKLTYFFFTYKKPLDVIDYHEEDKKRAGIQLLRAAKKITEGKYSVPAAFYLYDTLYLGIDLVQGAGSGRRAEQIGRAILETMEEKMHADLLCFLLSERDSLEHLRGQIGQKVEILQFRSIFPLGKLMLFSRIREETCIKEKEDFDWSLLEFVNEESELKLYKAIEGYVEHMFRGKDAEALGRFFVHILMRIEELSGEDILRKGPYYFEDSGQIAGFLKETYERCIARQERDKPRISSGTVARAQRFIKQNYHNPELSIEEFADSVGLSAGRLSVVFKAETGKTVMDCLTDERIRQAIYLLKNTNLKIYEVSIRTGYHSSQYFSKVFYKKTGKRPIDYR